MMQNTTPLNDDVTKIKTAKNCARRWNALFVARDSRKKKTAISPSTTNDAFDCSDLIIPPSHDLVNREAEKGIERWKDLAARVIVEEDGPTIAGKATEDRDSEGGVVPLRNHELLVDAAISGDKRKHRLLPYNFDYTCKRKKTSDTAADDDDDDNGIYHRPKVISLMDHTKTLHYDDELYHVFNSIKTSDELERIHALGSANKDVGDANAAPEVPHGCKHTLGVKNNLKEWLAKYSRMDAHSLGRLRIKDRHSNAISGDNKVFTTVNDEEMEDRGGKSSTTLQTTVRFEILRYSQNLKRGSSPDSNRMEVELHGSHTLLDLHRLLVECALGAESYAKDGEEDNVRAGVFFIENTFYTCGEVGDRSGEAIQRWLLLDKESGAMKDKSEKEEGPLPSKNAANSETTTTLRQYFLGLSSRNDLVPMSKMKLEELPLRLGVRYFHMFVPPPAPLNLRPNNLWSLANESAVYVTGIHTLNNNDTSLNNEGGEGKRPPQHTKAPIIIHDTWGPAQRQICFACNYSLASVVTVNDPLTDAAPPALEKEDSNIVHLQGVPMCSSCYQALHYQPSNRLEAEDRNSQPSLDLRSSHQPSLVFPIEDYQRMVMTTSLDSVPKNSAF